MEVVGAAASFIAIGQAIIAGRHVFNLLRSIPEISKEYEALDYEITTLFTMIEEAKSIAHLDAQAGPHVLFLTRVIHQLEEIIKDLASLQSECSKTTRNDDNRLKPRKGKWILLQTRLSKLQEKARDANLSLQTALHLMTWRITQSATRTLLQIGQTADVTSFEISALNRNDSLDSHMSVSALEKGTQTEALLENASEVGEQEA